MPGGLRDASFYKYCRAGGGTVNYREAVEIRAAWLSTFTEIDEHMKSEEEKETGLVSKAFGLKRAAQDDEDCPDYDEDGDPGERRKLYVGKTTTGMRRAHCTSTAAANMNFQGLVGEGAKLAGYELAMAGYQDDLHAFIHDEYVYSLWPEQVFTDIPRIEALMVAGMVKVIPDVSVKVESSIMHHWDKKCVIEFDDIRDSGVLPEIPEPPFVKSLDSGAT